VNRGTNFDKTGAGGGKRLRRVVKPESLTNNRKEALYASPPRITNLAHITRRRKGGVHDALPFAMLKVSKGIKRVHYVKSFFNG